MDSTRTENALLTFNAEFVKKGLGSAPDGLLQLLRSYKLKVDESPNQMRHRIYKRLWCIMWYGGKLGKEAAKGDQPTYVYPMELKAVVRGIIPGELSDFPDPTGPRIYQVSLKDLANAKWPVSKKKKT
ncbi:hypothetical protein AC249_AIPGENE20647 [Exaiptasia diaphana]|nr:hypothetical protein AC249_AIPGENE20647 [Exaiptasia diaphana]